MSHLQKQSREGAVTVHTGPPAPGPDSPDGPPTDFDRLVADILENPDRLLDESLTPEQVLEIQRRINPYAGIAAPPPEPGRKRVAVVSYTNLREDYLRRFTATSLVGFLFQVLHEWEVPAALRRWTPPKAAAKKDDPAAQPFAAAKLAERLESLLQVAREAEAAAAEAAALSTEAAALEADEAAAALSDEAPAAASSDEKKRSESVLQGILDLHKEDARIGKELMKRRVGNAKGAAACREGAAAKRAAAESAAAKHAGLLFAATHALQRAGADAGPRLRATAEAGLKHAEVRAIMARHPLPPPPGELEVPPAVAKGAIEGFLRHWFEFDPSAHVRSGHDAKAVAAAVEKVRVGSREVAADAKDPAHLTPEEVRRAPPDPAPEHAAALKAIRAAPGGPAAALELLRDADVADVVRGIQRLFPADGRRAAAAVLADDEYAAAVRCAAAHPLLGELSQKAGGAGTATWASLKEKDPGVLAPLFETLGLSDETHHISRTGDSCRLLTDATLRSMALGAVANSALAGARARRAAGALLSNPPLAEAALEAVQDEETSRAFLHYLGPVPAGSPARPAADVVPPQDTFHRWNYYTEVNYDALRTITEALYPERPDLDWALALWDAFEGTPAEVDAKFEKHCLRWQDEVPSSLKTLEFGAWSLLADFGENRKNIQYYNKNTEVLKRIMDRHAEDRRLGADLMRKRVVAAKAANIAVDGPDPPGLSRYKQSLAERGGALGRHGAEKVISAEQMRRLERARGNVRAAQELEVAEQLEETIRRLGEKEAKARAREEKGEKGEALTPAEAEELATARRDLARAQEMLAVPDNAVQVDVFTTDAATGEFKKSHFYTEAEAPEHLARDGGAPGAAHPAVRASEGKGRQPPPAAQLAPYAVDHILTSAIAERSETDRKAEALADAAARGGSA